MPQDSLRSVVYRSFVTCDDPKGVVECGTIRKSKPNTQKIEGRVESQKTLKNLGTSSSYKEERKNMVSKGSAEQLHYPSSLQLMEVSRGALKLNQVIDSWSRGMSSDGKSKDVAKDLLKGTLDLQESLVMFGKLQEASQYVAMLKKKQKDKPGKGRNYEAERERTNSYYNYPIEREKPRLSADGSSRDCYEELRKVIRDSLARQNLLSNSFFEEKEYFGGRNLDLSAEIPSKSSSLFSMVSSHKCAPLNSSISLSKILKQKPRGPNLIAKLMGLEEMPSKALQSALPEKSDGEKVLNQRRPIVDIDVPKGRKPFFVNQKMNPEGPEHRTLEEIIETMHYKGLLRRNSVENPKNQKRHSSGSNLKERFPNDAPPIVIIKPLQFPLPGAEEVHKDVIIQEDSPDRMPGKWKMKKEVLTENIDLREQGLISNEFCRKVHVEKVRIKRLSQGKGHKDSKEVLGKSEVKKVEIKNKLSSKKMNASVAVNSEVQKKEATEKKIDKIQKAAPSRGKRTETASVKAIGVSKSHDQVKLASAKETKPEARSNLSKNQTPQRKITISNSTEKGMPPTLPQKSCNRRKNVMDEKLVGEASAVNVENIGHNDDNLQIVHTFERDYDIKTISNVSPVQLQEGRNVSVISIEENCKNSPSLLEATLPTTQHESNTRNISEINCISHNVKEDASYLTRVSPKDQLLSRSSFVTSARELFDVETCQPIVMQTSLYDSEINNTRLLVDCANEVLERKSLICPSTMHPLLQIPARTSIISVSPNQLLEEVCEEIENLRIYSGSSGERLPPDTLYAVLQRDLWCKGVLSGTWDLGWKHGYTMVEVEQVVSDIERLALSGLIEDVLTDLML